MQHGFQRASLAPDGFAVDAVQVVAGRVQILLRPRQPWGTCAGCGGRSQRVQSRYRRQPSDLPLGGRPVELSILARRFWCDGVLCRRRIFCERFDDSVLARYSRRTQRLETIVHHLGLALGGRPAASFADHLMIPVSKDTLLRVVRRRITGHGDTLKVIGIDDFAFRSGQTYGTIVCDLERRRPVVLLPDRALNTSRVWLAEHPRAIDWSLIAEAAANVSQSQFSVKKPGHFSMKINSTVSSGDKRAAYPSGPCP